MTLSHALELLGTEVSPCANWNCRVVSTYPQKLWTSAQLAGATVIAESGLLTQLAAATAQTQYKYARARSATALGHLLLDNRACTWKEAVTIINMARVKRGAI